MTHGKGLTVRDKIIAIAIVSAAIVIGLCVAANQRVPDAQRPKPEERTGYGMGGVNQDVEIMAESIENAPSPWDLSTPESAVRSYLDWVSYGYRTADSDVASQTQSAYQLVRTDAYVQSNLQNQRLLDQTLTSLTFGAAEVDGDQATLKATEEWSYRYVSIVEAGKTVGGPYTAQYETTYKLVKAGHGWVVDSIEVMTIGEVQ